MFTWRPTLWADAIRENNFAAVLDWFSVWFFGAGAVTLVAADAAAFFDTPGGPGFATRVAAFGLIEAAACVVSGWVLGLVFGIPRSLSRPRTAGAGAGDAAAPHDRTSRANTNLEDLSDWLSKIIVGVGLTKLETIPGTLWNAAGAFDEAGMNWPSGGRVMVLGILVYFSVGGFWLGYVGTRTILKMLFDHVDGGASPSEIRTAADPANLRLAASGGAVAAAGPNVEQADRKLLAMPITAMNSPGDLAGWSAARARNGDLGSAKLGLNEARRQLPFDEGIKAQLATVYTASGDLKSAADIAQSLPDSALKLHLALYEEPDGFLRAIEIGEKPALANANASNTGFHIDMACAYGQQYKSLLGGSPSADTLAGVVAKAVTEIGTAIRLDGRAKATLAALAQPPPNAIDDDLKAIFDGEAAVRALLR